MTEAIKSRLRQGEDLEQLIAELQGNRAGPAPKTLGCYAQHFLDVVAPERLADSTLMGYESIYNSHWLHFDERRIDTLTLDELQRHLAKKKITKKTRKECVSVLRMIFQCAVPAAIPDNPIAGWKMPKAKGDKKHEPDPYTADERDELLQALRKWPEAWRYFVHGFGTGMRTGELLGAHWNDYEAPYFHVWQEWSGAV